MKLTCVKCKKEKESKDFFKNKTQKNGFDSYCKPCKTIQKRASTPSEYVNKYNRAYYLRNREALIAKCKKYNNEIGRYTKMARKYNLSVEEYTGILLQQNNQCAICKMNLSDVRKSCIDHNHSTGRVRGILCSNCNLGLGNFKDNSVSLANAIIYLK